MGSSDKNFVNCSLNKDSDTNGLSPFNDGSFIKVPACPNNDSVLNLDSESPMAIGSDPKDSIEQVGIGDVGNANPILPIHVDSTALAMRGMDFEFRKVDSSKGILNKPLGSLLNTQFGSNIPINPFVRKSVDITKTNSGIFYFKFKSEDGMKNVLESGPWMVQNIPLVLNVWEPGIWLEKVEHSFIPIWVCVYNTLMEVCNGNTIRKIMSGIGKPLLMDKMTKKRCLRKVGKLDFVRVLVEVSADDDLLSVLEIAYPPIGNSLAKVGKLDVKYQWKPPLCTQCKTFGHSTLSCKVRPRTKEENAAAILKEALNVRSDPKCSVDAAMNDDGFVTVDEEEDVNSDVEGVAFGMKLEIEVGSAEILENNSTNVKEVSNGT
uniref:DUF4283 domain-containing protein n=1 Tax=Tanacetum cinerariifolium TaxID=118510 RepID=A0A699JM99_TANCI|nr:hypothetical protein CTI12_AA318980 [Tanacetum cinerariifolium]